MACLVRALFVTLTLPRMKMHSGLPVISATSGCTCHVLTCLMCQKVILVVCHVDRSDSHKCRLMSHNAHHYYCIEKRRSYCVIILSNWILGLIENYN